MACAADDLAAVAKPGAMLAAQCGGAGNIEGIATVLDGMGVDPFASKLFATPQQTSERLDGAGFTEIECWLHPEPMPFRTVDELATYLETVVLGDHVEHLAPDAAQAFALEVAERMPRLEIDYVRLNIRARRAS